MLGRYPGLRVIVLAADLPDEHEAERLLAKAFEQAGAVDVLVNSAGLGDSVLFDRAEWARTRQILRTNICGGPGYVGFGARHGRAPPRRSAQHRVGRGPDGSAQFGRVCRGASISSPDSAKRCAPTFQEQA
jgi:NAD(P)-dependent dehydrogenase (short-subunit alcohol dehydrogenase family)